MHKQRPARGTWCRASVAGEFCILSQHGHFGPIWALWTESLLVKTQSMSQRSGILAAAAHQVIAASLLEPPCLARKALQVCPTHLSMGGRKRHRAAACLKTLRERRRTSPPSPALRRGRHALGPRNQQGGKIRGKKQLDPCRYVRAV